MTSFYLTVAIKLALGLISLVFVMNLTGKGNLAPSSATDQVQNFVLGGIIGGTIYSSNVSILQYIVIVIIWTILILLLKWLNNNIRFIKHLIDGKPTVIIKRLIKRILVISHFRSKIKIVQIIKITIYWRIETVLL